MSSLRSLLRLDDKVAAEGRRLRRIGGPPMRWVAPAALATAVILHALVLLLPVGRSRAELPPPSVATEFPLAWWPNVEAVQPSIAISKPRSAPGTGQEAASPPAARLQIARPDATTLETTRDLPIEPVPEPPPELVLSAISAQFEPIVPNPDPPPAPDDAGPMPESVPGTSPQPIQQVKPVYPLAARTFLADGKVTLKLYVLPDGTVGHATVESCTRRGLGFETAALRAVKQWRYESAPPGSSTRTIDVTVHFQRQDKRP